MSKSDSGGGAGVGGGSAGGGSASAAPRGDGKHSIALPKTKSRLTIDQAAAAFKEMGGRIDKASGKYDPKAKATTYEVKTPNGKSQRMTAKEISKAVYAGQRK